MKRRTALLGVVAGLATVAIAEVVKPRGGTSLLLDWEEVRRSARARLGHTVSHVSLAAAAKNYRALAGKLEKPLLDFVGGLPAGVELPEFEALDREGWLDLNLGIMRRVVDPVLEKGRLPNSLMVEFGRTGLDHYLAFMLAFLGRRVLGQYDPQLLGVEPIDAAGLYLVETNVDEWGRKAELPQQDLRRWLILHEMTHAWQFAAHPWLRGHMEQSMRVLLETVTQKTSPAARIAAFAGVLPAQWRVMRQMQGTMSLIEGYSNLVMNELGAKLLPGFDELEEAYRRRSSSKSVLDQLIWKFTGLDLKLQQYRRGEAFAKAVYDAHGIEALNLAWRSPNHMPKLEELGNPENWYKRVTR
ncbi:MAG: zinc-dependent metalloprotease [Candidatus Dormibacteraeota bacterium]|nr:zinc-dependent metalloprotease [Candidatus Dormibacteraeota bacterium]